MIILSFDNRVKLFVMLVLISNSKVDFVEILNEISINSEKLMAVYSKLNNLKQIESV